MSVTNADQVLRYKGFNVEIKGADSDPSEVDSSWVTVSGGGLGSKGNASPGKALEEEISLRGPITPDRKSLARWLSDTQTGGDVYRMVTITLIPLDTDNKPRETIIFYDAFLTAYVLPRFDLADPCPDLPVEEVRFSFGRAITFPS
jgi:hypothetical protein